MGSPWQMISTCSWIGEEQGSDKINALSQSEFLSLAPELELLVTSLHELKAAGQRTERH